jgi:hypothetical protein
LPIKDPQFCTVLFDLADLVFRLFNGEFWMMRAKEQDEMLDE